MYFYVYMLKSTSVGFNKTYVGYTKNIKNRLIKHNSNKGAKSTKGHKWILIYKKRFKTKKKNNHRGKRNKKSSDEFEENLNNYFGIEDKKK